MNVPGRIAAAADLQAAIDCRYARDVRDETHLSGDVDLPAHDRRGVVGGDTQHRQLYALWQECSRRRGGKNERVALVVWPPAFPTVIRSWTSLTVFVAHTFGIVISALVALAASAPAVTTQLDLLGLTPDSAVASSTTEEMLAPAGSTH